MNSPSTDTHFAVLELRLADMETEIKTLKEKVDATEKAKERFDASLKTANFLTKIFFIVISGMTMIFYYNIGKFNKFFGG